jgi:hypothetical protein
MKNRPVSQLKPGDVILHHDRPALIEAVAHLIGFVTKVQIRHTYGEEVWPYYATVLVYGNVLDKPVLTPPPKI